MDQQYKILITQDGSPSLREQSVNGDEGESMHHLGGAYSETQYIYGDALRMKNEHFKTNDHDFNVMIVGLGLGYIELLAVGEYLKLRQMKSSDFFAKDENNKFHMVSYECDPFLRESFLSWIQGNLDTQNYLFPVYEQISHFFIKDGYDMESIKSYLSQMHKIQNWIIYDFLKIENFPSMKMNKIMYDAFSGFSTPTLWEEDFLNALLLSSSADHCVFSTYACKGALKRALINNHFHFEKRKGFLGKRDSTLAIKPG